MCGEFFVPHVSQTTRYNSKSHQVILQSFNHGQFYNFVLYYEDKKFKLLRKGWGKLLCRTALLLTD
jgi:hypothetical protein